MPKKKSAARLTKNGKEKTPRHERQKKRHMKVPMPTSARRDKQSTARGKAHADEVREARGMPAG